MNYKITLPILAIILLGGFFAGKGITGFVVSQSCCFGTSCDGEYLCSNAPHLESPSMLNTFQGQVILGLSIIVFAILVYFLIYFRRD